MSKVISSIIKKDLKEHEVMREHTSLKVGGVADFYFEAKSVNDLISAVKAAKETHTPYIVLGEGTNIVFSDFGFPGLIIRNQASSIAVMNEKSQIIADAGVLLSKFILEATSQNLSGLEFLYGVPGTLGGAIYGNAGAFGQSIGDFVRSATILIIKDNEPKILQKDWSWFEFEYRNSRLKKFPGLSKPVILSARVQLAQNRQEEIMRRINIYKEKRASSQPINDASASIFKNPIPSELRNFSGKGSSTMPEIPKERTASFMLDQSGAKKLRVGDARVFNRHANYIVNKNQAKAQEIRQLIEEMRNAVNAKFNIVLEEEIEYVGQW